MPIVNLDLTDEDAARIDKIAAKEKRARKHQCYVLVMTQVAEVEETEKEDEP